MARTGTRCGTFFFFFQAEDGIRDLTVTGVQTCALPIWLKGWNSWASFSGGRPGPVSSNVTRTRPVPASWHAIFTEPPGRLYLIALDNRLTNTCLTRVRSALTK